MIYDQCEKCRKKGTEECQVTPIFDGTPCCNYVKSGIDLEKYGKTEDIVSEDTQQVPIDDNPLAITRESLKRTTAIGGWLLWLLIIVGFGSAGTFILSIANYAKSSTGSMDILGLGDVVLGFLHFFVGFYTIYSFASRQSNAVFVGKIYIFFTLLSNLFLLIMGNYESNGLGSLPQLIRSVVWSVIWFLFLCYSKQVEEVIPKSYRKRKERDYYLIGLYILIPLIFFALGIKDTISTRQHSREKMINTVCLASNEYTDGIVVFKCPYDFSCEAKNLEVSKNNTVKLHQLESDNATITVISDFEDDKSWSNFNEYWRGWKDDDTKGYEEETTYNEELNINGHTALYRVVEFSDGYNEFVWRYMLLFEDKHSKVTVISAYDRDMGRKFGRFDYLQTFVKGIRFE